MRTVNVLIAEDDFRVASIHEKFLNKMDDVLVVGKAINAKETMNLLDQVPCDLLLLDVYMPDKLGTDLLLDIREKHPNVDVVLITAATDKEFLEKAIRNGVQSYLLKPVTLERFQAIISTFLKKRELLDSVLEVSQELVDELFAPAKQLAPGDTKPLLPKGIDPITLKKVSEILEANAEGYSAEKVGQMMGASRTTARRYLEYLISVGKSRAELVYGVVGRPERHYFHLVK